jgi:hypothetical protein
MEYSLDVPELLRLGLDLQKLPYGFPDWRPPEYFITALSVKTGVEPEVIRKTTFTGVLPFLFSGTVKGKSVLLPPSDRPLRDLLEWLPWLRNERLTQLMACRACLANYPKAGILLSWRLTLVLSCPEHRLMLEAVRVTADSVYWLGEAPENAPDLVHLLDSRICQALTEGYVEMPSGKVQAGDWFRLMQTIQEELSRRLYGHWNDSSLIQKVWAESDDCPAGYRSWKSFEQISPHRRRSMLIATAMDLIERGSITPKGADAELFIPS